MNFKVGDKVVYHNTSNRVYAWELGMDKIYIIENRAFDNTGEMFYGVESDETGQYSTWYLEQDFISFKEERRKKLKKLSSIF